MRYCWIILLAAIVSTTHAQDRDFQIQLGRELFHDTLLSRDNDVSCATCHDSAHGWSDGLQRAIGRRTTTNDIGDFNTPTILNARYKVLQFHDGRTRGLSNQAMLPTENRAEMGNVSADVVVRRLVQVPRYRELYRLAFGDSGISRTRTEGALAAYESTLVSLDCPLDRFIAGDYSALNESEKRGLLVAHNAQCFTCHRPGSDYRTDAVANTGVSLRLGDTKSTLGANGRNEFVVPTWRELERTAPYFHNGKAGTIRDVIEHYNFGAYFPDNSGNLVRDARIDARIRPLALTERDKLDLENLLRFATASPTYPND